MSSATRTIVVTALLGMMLGGCSEYFDRRDTVSLASGEAMAANRVTQMVDPWPAVSGNRNIASSGERAAAASARYRTGRVIQPRNATTSETYAAQPHSATAGTGVK
jgi:hypothetical protein